jgi:hypothetical protein
MFKIAGEQNEMVEFAERKARSAGSINYRIAGGLDNGEAKTKVNASPRGGA